MCSWCYSAALRPVLFHVLEVITYVTVKVERVLSFLSGGNSTWCTVCDVFVFKQVLWFMMDIDFIWVFTLCSGRNRSDFYFYSHWNILLCPCRVRLRCGGGLGVPCRRKGHGSSRGSGVRSGPDHSRHPNLLLPHPGHSLNGRGGSVTVTSGWCNRLVETEGMDLWVVDVARPQQMLRKVFEVPPQWPDGPPAGSAQKIKWFKSLWI